MVTASGISKELPHWIVSRIKGNRAEYITTIPAKDAESAISIVIRDRGITDREFIKRMAARPG